MSRLPHPAHYTDATYLGGGRGISFGHQIETILSMRPTSLLEVGVGSGIVASAIRQIGVPVTTLDLDPELDPDIVASVTSIPAADGTWDVAACCQVLEHLPFNCFGSALRELHRVTSRGLVLSLPDATRQMEFFFRLPRLGTGSVSRALPFLRARSMPAEKLASMGHHWEIGFAGTPLSTVTSVMAVSGWHIERTWRVREMPWHRFFDLRHHSANAR
jgi:hypothetical protein